MEFIYMLILGLLASTSLAQTGGTTGGSITGGDMTSGMSDESPTAQGTITALEDGITNLSAQQAVDNIEGWQMRLENAGDPALLAIAEQLEELKTELQTDSVDQTSVGLLLIELGERTGEAATMASGEEAAQLVSLGTLLSDAGSSLSEIEVEDIEVTGGVTGGGMTGGN